MQIARVNALLRLNQNGNPGLMSVPKFGPDALLVTEIPILRMINDIDGGGEEDCCLSEVAEIAPVEASKGPELERLRSKYGQALVNTCYPGGRGLPQELKHCELPHTAMAKRSARVEVDQIKTDPKAKVEA